MNAKSLQPLYGPCCLVRGTRYCPDPKLIKDAKVRAEVMEKHCQRVNAPLMSTKTAHVHSEWRWVGLDHKEPFSEYLCSCPGCRLDYALIIYTPQ